MLLPAFYHENLSSCKTNFHAHHPPLSVCCFIFKYVNPRCIIGKLLCIFCDSDYLIISETFPAGLDAQLFAMSGVLSFVVLFLHYAKLNVLDKNTYNNI